MIEPRVLDIGTVEELRVRLRSHNTTHLVGYAQGAGDSVDEFWCLPFRVLCRDEIAEITVEAHPTTGHLYPFAKLKDGITVELEMYVEWGVDMDVVKVPVTPPGNTKQYNLNAYLVTKVKVPKDLTAEIDHLFEKVVDSYPEWDFNNDGSQGFFYWDLITNKSEVEASYNISNSEDFGGSDIMGEEFDTVLVRDPV